MRHVFVETNWVVEYAAPEHLQVGAAGRLLESAGKGQLSLYLPAVSLTEARHPIRTKYQPRSNADPFRQYLVWAKRGARANHMHLDTARLVLDQYEAAVSAELSRSEDRLRALTRHPGVEVFALNDRMLARAVELSSLNLDLKPFDQAILAAVLIWAEELREAGAHEVAFCELDSDLRPLHKDGQMKQPLASLYEAAGVWVYGDFAMQYPPRPPTFLG